MKWLGWNIHKRLALCYTGRKRLQKVKQSGAFLATLIDHRTEHVKNTPVTRV